MEDLERLAYERDIAQIVFEMILHHDSAIADNMEDFWKHTGVED